MPNGYEVWKRTLSMEFHQLRYFVAAAEELSMTGAARRLHVSQPALSRQVAALEEELGVPLFERVRKRIRLTEAGRYFLPKARQLLCDAETGAQQLREFYGTATRTLRVGFLTPFLDDLVTPAVKALRREASRVRVSLYELPPRGQLDRLRDGGLDLAILGNLGEEDRHEFSIRPLMRSRMAAVLPGEHRLAQRKRIDLEELSGEPFASLSDALFPGRSAFLRHVCRSRGFEPDLAEECDSIPLLFSAVSGGVGVALLPEHSAKLPHAGCVFVPLRRPTAHAEVSAVHQGTTAAPPLDAFLRHLEAAADAVRDRAEDPARA